MDGTEMEIVYVSLWQNSVKQDAHKKVLIADALGAHFKKQVLRMFHAANTWVCRIPTGTTSFLQYLDVYFFAIWKDTIFWMMLLEFWGRLAVNVFQPPISVS